LTGQEIPDNLDGISFLPAMLGKPGQAMHEYLYWEFHEQNGKQAIRKGDWKLVRLNLFNPDNENIELYNIPEDPGEEHNLAGEYPEIRDDLLEMLESARTESDVFPFRRQPRR
jgi:arylsulfatase A-like enzyme